MSAMSGQMVGAAIVVGQATRSVLAKTAPEEGPCRMRRPLSVVGTDQEALRALLAVHACPEPRILDVTHNRGRMWKGLPYTPRRSDRDPTLHEQGFTDTVADFRALPFDDGSFDVIVFDPPHIDHARGALPSDNWTERYGLKDEGYRAEGTMVVDLFKPFLLEARRVLAPNGMVLAKIADAVHSHRYQWQHIALHDAARCRGRAAGSPIRSGGTSTTVAACTRTGWPSGMGRTATHRPRRWLM
jgi:SAM-dependent methyltransferase